MRCDASEALRRQRRERRQPEWRRAELPSRSSERDRRASGDRAASEAAHPRLRRRSAAPSCRPRSGRRRRGAAGRGAGTTRRGSGVSRRRCPRPRRRVRATRRRRPPRCGSARASTLKYAIDSLPSDSTSSTRASIVGRLSWPWPGWRSPARRPTITGRPSYSRSRGYGRERLVGDRQLVAAEVDRHAAVDRRRSLEQVHRRRADEAGDEEVRRPVVQALRGVDLLQARRCSSRRRGRPSSSPRPGRA